MRNQWEVDHSEDWPYVEYQYPIGAFILCIEESQDAWRISIIDGNYTLFKEKFVKGIFHQAEVIAFRMGREWLQEIHDIGLKELDKLDLSPPNYR